MLFLLACSLLARPEPGPFAGDQWIDATVACAADAAGTDAPALEARMERLRIGGSIDRVDPRRLRLHLSRVAGGTLDQLTAPGRLSLSEVLDWPKDIVLPTHVLRQGDDLVAERAEAFAGLVLPTATHVGTQCGLGRCTAYLLGEPEVAGADVAGAEAEETPVGTMVDLRFTPEGGARLEALTRRLVNRRLAIELDGAVRSVPKVMEAISGGRASLSMEPGEGLAEAHALAAALARPLTCRWQLEELR